MTLLTILLLKTLLVFAAAGLALIALRRASASARHLVCLLTLAALLALPCLSLALPGWQMLPAWTPPAVSAPVSPPAPTPVIPLTSNNGGTGEDKRAETSPAPTGLFPAPPLLGAGGQNAPPRPFPWLHVVIALYAFGVLLALTRPLLGLWGIRQLSRISVSVIDTSMQALAADCAAALRLPRLPALRQAAVPVPMTWGSRRPVVLLPQEAAHWPEDRLRAVLLHEMAHVRRQDWPGHRLADVTCALYWFHPLVWLTARRLRAESEAACDDLVLASGIAAPDYARHLLEIARALPPVSTIFPQAAIAMAQTSQVESRLQMILTKNQNRRQITRRVALTTLGLSIVLLTSLAMLRPVAKAQETAGNSISSSWQRKLANGATVELIGVSDYPATQARWWKPSGSLLAQPPYDHIASDLVHVPRGGQGRQFALRVLPPAGVTADEITNRFEVKDAAGTGYATPSAQGRLLPNLWAVSIEASTLPTQGLIRCGVAAGPWETLIPDADADVNFGPKSVSIGFHGTEGIILFSPASEKSDNTVITVTNTFLNAECRVIAEDINGKVFKDSSTGSVGGGPFQQTTCVFAGLPLKHVKEFRFEARPYQWTEFKNVALQPAK